MKSSTLVNSLDYRLEYVFILKEEDGFRLVVKHGGLVLTNQTFKSLPDARTAFQNLYPGPKGVRRPKPHWSAFIDPEQEWFGHLLYIINMQMLYKGI
jgi:hypothetical protein